MTDKAKELLSLTVQQIVRDNMPQFENILFEGVLPEMDKDHILTKMILNSITLSVDLSTQIICEFLDSSDILNFPEDERLLQKLALKIHTDDLSE